jgi:SHS2 domain-containing protein
MRPYSRSEEHLGEWKLCLWADTLEELFAEAARQISRRCGPSTGPPGAWKRVSVTSRDGGTLLVDWLNELLGRSEIDHCAYSEVRSLVLADGYLEAEIRGQQVAEWRSPLKAATYHGLSLACHGRRWRGVVLFDV